MDTRTSKKRLRQAAAVLACAAVLAGTGSAAAQEGAAGQKGAGRTAQNPPEDERGADSLRTHPIGEVVITGSNAATGRDLLPYTVSTVGRSRLEATGRTQLLSALSGRIPSLFVTERNTLGFGVSTGGAGGIKIRGVGGSPTNGVLMMVDGQPQFAGIYSHHVADSYGTEQVERVEVLRGPGSVLYGSNAMGGVINVITREAAEEGARTTLTAQYGSRNTLQSSLANTLRYGRFSSLVSLGYDRTDGTERHFDFRQQSLYAKIGYELSARWRARADLSLMNATGNDPVYPRLDDPQSTDIYHQNITRGAASLAFTNRYERTDGSIRLYYSYGNHYVDDPRHFHSLDDRLGALLYQNFRPWRGARATLGFDFDTYTGKIPVSGGKEHAEGSLTTIGRKRITEYAPYATLSQELFGGILIVNAGLRLTGSDRFGSQWIPQGGAVVRPAEGWVIRASVAKGYRNPSFRELYLYRTANAGLEPERMTNWELSIGKRFAHGFSVELTGYYSKGSNLIQTVEMHNVNTGRFTNKGIELSLAGEAARTLALHASYSYLHTSLDDLTAAPRHQYHVGATWQAAPRLLIDAGLHGVFGLYVSDEADCEQYALLDMKVSWQALRQLELFVTLDNITDTRYTINRGYTMPGITAAGGLRLRF